MVCITHGCAVCGYETMGVDMSLLTDDEVNKAWEDACTADPTGAQQRFKLTRAIESAVLAKLAGMELPDPGGRMQCYDSEGTPYSEPTEDYTADQLRQAYAQGAASVLSGAEPVYQYQMGDGSWIDQAKHSYDYNRQHAPNAVLRIVFTRKEPT